MHQKSSERGPSHPLDPHLSAIREDLVTVADELRWAYSDAWWPTTSDPTAPSRTGADGVVEVSTDPDVVRGPKYALGLGDDTTRAALGEVIGELAHLEVRVAVAVFEAGRRRRQPSLVRPDHLAQLVELDLVVAGIGWRLDALGEDGPGLGRPALKVVRTHLAEGRGHADRCVRRLSKALGRGKAAGVAHAEPRCRICGIRPQAQREGQVRLPNGDRGAGMRPSKGGRCDTCAQWFARNGQERPVGLDTVDDALAAAARRRGRGEGWGSG